MAKRDEGIDLLDESKPLDPSYLAGLVCNMVGVPIGGSFDDIRYVEEFRVDIHGLYVRLSDDEEVYVTCQRAGKVLAFPPPSESEDEEVACVECGSYVPPSDVSDYSDTDVVCVTCADELAKFEQEESALEKAKTDWVQEAARGNHKAEAMMRNVKVDLPSPPTAYDDEEDQ